MNKSTKAFRNKLIKALKAHEEILLVTDAKVRMIRLHERSTYRFTLTGPVLDCAGLSNPFFCCWDSDAYRGNAAKKIDALIEFSHGTIITDSDLWISAN